MSSRVTLQGQRPDETVTSTFDFTSRLAATETISTAVTTATVYSGPASASNLTLPTATISGQTVTQRIGGGTLGAVYYLRCKITTSASQTLELAAYLPIIGA